MMTKAKHRNFGEIFFFMALIASVCALIAFPADSVSAAKDGLKMGTGVILPSLFPFFVISSIMINTGGADRLGKALSPLLSRLFGTGNAGASAFVIGLLGGYPLGAKTVAGLYESGSCTRSEAENLLGFVNNSGPAFILGACGAGVFQSTKVGFILLMSHILSAVMVGMIFRRGGKSTLEKCKKTPVREYDDFPTAFVNAVKSSIRSIIDICGFVIFFEVVMAMLGNAHLLPGGILGTLIQGMIELTAGIFRLGGYDPIIALPLTSFFLGWGGLCVHCQAMSFALPHKLGIGKYFLGKLIHGIISAGVTLGIYLIIK